MFTDEDISQEVIVQPQQVLFHFIVTIPLNIRAENGIIQTLLLRNIIILHREIKVVILSTSNNK